jgi:Tol biopolymer transport system component
MADHADFEHWLRLLADAIEPDPPPNVRRVIRRGRTRIVIRLTTVALAVMLVAGGLGWGAFALAGLHHGEPVQTGLGGGTIIFSAYPPSLTPAPTPVPDYVPPSNLYAWVPDTGRIVRLTNGHDTADIGPVVSPDGRRVAFERLQYPGYLVHVIDVGGSDDHPVTTCNLSECARDPSWFPESDRLVIWRTGSIWAVNADRGGAKMLLHFGPGGIGHVALSPDGKLIAFHRNISSSDVVVMSSDGTHQRLLTSCPVSESLCADLGGIDEFRWSPDSTTLLLQAGRNLWRIGADGRDRQRLTSCPPAATPGTCQAENASFSPDGKWIVYDNARQSITFMQSDGSDSRTVVVAPTCPSPARTSPVCWVSDPVWSPDGAFIAFVVTDRVSTRIEVVDRGGHEVAMSPPVTGAGGLTWQELRPGD